MAKFKKECLYFDFDNAEALTNLIGKKVFLGDDISELRERISEAREFPERLKEIDLDSYGDIFISADNRGHKYCYYDPDLIIESHSVTNRELAQWLASGRGQILYKEQVKMAMEYVIDMENEPVPEYVKVRAWEDDIWNIPTEEYLER